MGDLGIVSAALSVAREQLAEEALSLLAERTECIRSNWEEVRPYSRADSI